MRSRIVLVAVALLITAACGRTGVTVLSESELPEDVYGSPVPTPTPTLELPPKGTVYMVREGRLRPVSATLQGGAASLPAAYLQALILAPRNLPPKVHTVIPSDTRLISVNVEGTTATIDLSAEFERGGPSRDLQLRVAQVVYTVTEDEGVSSVQMFIEGDPRSVPKPGGAVDPGPVDRSDYAAFSPPED